MRTRGVLIVVAILAMTLLFVNRVVSAPPVLTEAVRELVESVLGPGTVKAIRSAEGGSQILLRWESQTFAQARTVEDARHMIYGEAVLATGAIFGQLQTVRRVRFTVVRGDRMLASGEHVRGQEARMTFAGELGGLYTPSAPATAPKPKPSGGATQEL